MKNLMKTITILVLLAPAYFMTGCGDLELRSGSAIAEHYSYQKYVVDAINDDSQAKYDQNGDLICQNAHITPYAEDPTYCEQFPGIECCTWRDVRATATCEIEWCQWQDSCEWEFQEMNCF